MSIGPSIRKDAYTRNCYDHCPESTSCPPTIRNESFYRSSNLNHEVYDLESTLTQPGRRKGDRASNRRPRTAKWTQNRSRPLQLLTQRGTGSFGHFFCQKVLYNCIELLNSFENKMLLLWRYALRQRTQHSRYSIADHQRGSVLQYAKAASYPFEGLVI